MVSMYILRYPEANITRKSQLQAPMAKQGQGNARKWRSFETSKAHCFATKTIDRYSFVFIPVHGNGYWTLLDYRLTCVSVSRGPLLVELYALKTI